MPGRRQTRFKNPAHEFVKVHQEKDDRGNTYSVWNCIFCEDCTQRLKHNGPKKPRVKINRFAEHFGLYCEECPTNVSEMCLRKCKSQRSQIIKAEKQTSGKTHTDGSSSSSKRKTDSEGKGVKINSNSPGTIILK